MVNSAAALPTIQRLESSRQRGDLKLVLNRLVRTRMLGGVGGVPGNRAPIPIGGFQSRWRPRGGKPLVISYTIERQAYSRKQFMWKKCLKPIAVICLPIWVWLPMVAISQRTIRCSARFWPAILHRT